MYWKGRLKQSVKPVGGSATEAVKQTLKRAKAPCIMERCSDSSVFRADTIQTSRYEKIPLTTKDDLRGPLAYGFLAVSRDKLIRMHSSSGTTGRRPSFFIPAIH